MKSYASTSTDSERPDGFLAYMVPSQDEVYFSQKINVRICAYPVIFGQDYLTISSWLWWQLEKDIYDETEDISYSWVREYHYDVCFQDAHFASPSYFGFCVTATASLIMSFNHLTGTRWWCGWSHNVPCVIWWYRSKILGLSFSRVHLSSSLSYRHAWLIFLCTAPSEEANSEEKACERGKIDRGGGTISGA